MAGGRLPSPPREFDARWGAELIRGLDRQLEDLARPIGVGYRTYQANPLRVFDAQDGRSAVGSVGTVNVIISGAQGCRVDVTGVGGSYVPPDNGVVSRVLATLIADGKARGSIG